MENFEFKNSRYQGNAGMGAAIAYYTQQQMTVSIPLTDSTHYDLIVENTEGELLKIQCKTTKSVSPYGTYIVRIATSGGNKSSSKIKKFDASIVDYLFVLTSDGRWYNIPAQNISSGNMISLGKSKDQYLVNGTIKREFIESRLISERSARRREKAAAPRPEPKARPTKISWPSRDSLVELVTDLGYSETGRRLGVSDNAVRKRLNTR